MKPKVNYYKTYEDDFVESKNQNYKLKENYKWIHTNLGYRFFSAIVYRIAYIFSIVYCKFVLHIKIENGKILKKYKKDGYFLYANHTQPFGDVFIPAYVNKTKRIYVIVSPSNLGVAGIGKLLPMLGAIPIPESIKKIKDFEKAIEKRIKEKNCVVIYPEAHVWPYYTKIRQYKDTSFKFPVQMNKTSFCMTTTYYKRKFFKKPGIRIYIDGPFITNEKENVKEAKQKLYDEIYNIMVKRSENSTYEYIKYKKEQLEEKQKITNNN